MSSPIRPFLVILFFVSSIGFGQSPANDTCSSAQSVNLSVLPVETTGSNIGANDDAFPECSSFPGGKDVFFTFVLGAPTDLVIDTMSSGFDTILSLRQGSCGSPVEIACNDDFEGIFSRLDLQQLPAGTYTLLLDGFDVSAEGQYNLRFSRPETPANDTCDQAQAITTGNRTGSTLGATDTPGMRIPSLPSEGPDVFYRFTAPSTQMRVDTLESSLDTTLGVFTGCGGTLIGSNGDFEGSSQSLISLTGLAIGTEYLIQVDAPTGEAGTFVLQLLEMESPPANDTCNDSASFTTLPANLSGSTEFANNQTAPTEGGNGPEVYYRVSIPNGGNLVVETEGSAFDTVVYVRKGSCSGTQVGYNDDFLDRMVSRLVLEGLVGDDYFVFVDSKTVSDRGNFQLRITSTLAPPNDTCETASVLTLPTSLTGSTEFASNSQDVDSGGCLSLGPEVVYSFTLETPRRVTFNTFGSGFDTVLYLAQGECGSETVLACNDDAVGLTSSIEDFEEDPLPAGTYRLYVDGNNESGGFTLNTAFLDTPTLTPTLTPSETPSDTPTPTPTDPEGPTETPTDTLEEATETPTPTFISRDVNEDGSIDVLDLLILNRQRRTGIIDPEDSADFDRSNAIDHRDLFHFSGAWTMKTGANR